MQPADRIQQPSNLSVFILSLRVSPPYLPEFLSLAHPLIFLLPFISLVTCAPSPCSSFFFPISFIYLNILSLCPDASLPFCSGECPVFVPAPSEARLPVAAGRRRRAWEHHNIWRRGRGRGWHGCLWHRGTAERAPQLTLTWLPHPGQQEYVSSQGRVWESSSTCDAVWIYMYIKKHLFYYSVDVLWLYDKRKETI